MPTKSVSASDPNFQLYRQADKLEKRILNGDYRPSELWGLRREFYLLKELLSEDEAVVKRGAIGARKKDPFASVKRK